MRNMVKLKFFLSAVTGGFAFLIFSFFNNKILHMSDSFLPFAIGSIVGIIVAFLIIQNTKLKQTEFQLLKERKRLEEYVELANVMFVVLDANGNVAFINKKGSEILGYSKEEILGKNWIESFIPKRIKEEIEELFCGCEDLISDLVGYHENPVLTRDGQERIIAWHNKVIFDDHGNIKRVLSAGQDITEKKKAEEQLKLFATIDTMTNTLNRRAGLSFLEKQLKLADRNRSSLTVCFIDANGLKNVNDVYGHLEGDDYIIRTSQMLKETIRESDSIIRIGGDEFLLVLPDCTLDEAKIIWERFLKKIEEFNSQKIKPYQMSLSHGCEEYNVNNQLSIEKLLTSADEKMYEDKRKYKMKE